MNPVLLLTHNCLALTKRCVESVLAQDVPTTVHIYDNESTDGTAEWLSTRPDIVDQSSGVDLGVSAGWNFVLEILFSNWSASHVLVVGNDTVLPPWFYRALLTTAKPFVTGVAVDRLKQAWMVPEVMPLTPNPDFSAFLIRREAWEKIGPFDERMKHYCSDCDYHIRGHRLGIPMMKAAVPFYHERSSTLRLAPPAEQQEIQEQANKDREVFKSIYGCLPGTKEYEELFK